MKNKIIYWAATGLFCFAMASSAYLYFTSEEIKGVFVHLGFPSYFRIELGVAKILGVIALIIPLVPRSLKQFAYAGFTINIISALIAHLASGDGAMSSITPIVLFSFLVISKIYYDKLKIESLAK